MQSLFQCQPLLSTSIETDNWLKEAIYTYSRPYSSSMVYIFKDALLFGPAMLTSIHYLPIHERVETPSKLQSNRE